MSLDNKDIYINFLYDIVDYLENRQNENELRLIFYLIILCEIFRNEDSIYLGLRKKTKKYCEYNESNAYNLYMRIIDSTQTCRSIQGIQTGFVVDRGIKRQGSQPVKLSSGLVIGYTSYDIPADAVELNLNTISSSEYNFLFKTSLYTILKKHNIIMFFDKYFKNIPPEEMVL